MFGVGDHRKTTKTSPLWDLSLKRPAFRSIEQHLDVSLSSTLELPSFRQCMSSIFFLLVFFAMSTLLTGSVDRNRVLSETQQGKKDQSPDRTGRDGSRVWNDLFQPPDDGLWHHSVHQGKILFFHPRLWDFPSRLSSWWDSHALFL